MLERYKNRKEGKKVSNVAARIAQVDSSVD